MKTYIKDNATKIIFMAAVFSFLGVSIPKVASIYHLYEPDDSMWWVFAYLAAAGIDVLVGYLTLIMMNREARRRDKVIIWTFIIALMAYSWYCNWLFDELHSPVASNVWSMQLFALPVVGTWTVAQLTPIIVAMLPVFVVGYATIAHLINIKVAPISLEELQRQADEAQARAAAQVAINHAQQRVAGSRATGLIDLGRNMLQHALSNDPQQPVATTSPQQPVVADGEVATDPRLHLVAKVAMQPATSNKQKVTAFLDANPEARVKDIVEGCDVDKSQASRYLKAWKEVRQA